ncbi:acyl-protein thioesterase 1,2, putative [Metarhizium acridum CQMa 102]|uniref:Acyl-protein thioesterase 1,2, putative n=1 Tax=Metarhizium acridum (strain CQMa 102) TaxID=655827 RepID=E9E0K5_METAQ|nr:acyl-protein thioesterase 1,2, putative [Metarhizium acridum CQMa 102]EFY90625.1 acyl-protein thioesterase 1,2, putative [Metarhizium acridum CQMa 102]
MTGEFPPAINIPPLRNPHGITVIFLHGRGFNAQKFHGSLLQTDICNHTFQEALPHARFVFPTAPLSRASKYRRILMHQWYDGTGDWEPEARGGMQPSIEHIHGLIRSEIEVAGNDSKRIVLAGFSQGAAMAFVSSLLWDGDPLGAVVGLCGFMPLASHLLSILDDDGFAPGADDVFEASQCADARTPHQKVLDELREEAELPGTQQISDFQFLSTPVFVGHGSADREVVVQHASQAGLLLQKLGLDVDFHIYEGLGHWYSASMLRDLVQFLATQLKVQPPLG